MVVVVDSLKDSIHNLIAAVGGNAQQIGIDIELERSSPYKDGEPVKGNVYLHTITGKLQEGASWTVSIELVGHLRIESYKNPVDTNFCYVQKSLPCLLNQAIPFMFKGPDLSYNTYDGTRACIRYWLKCSICKDSGCVAYKEQELIVVNSAEPPPPKPLHIDVGIDDCLHIDLKLDKNSISIYEQILGNVMFTVVRLIIKHMELNIVRTESVGGPIPDGSSEIHGNIDNRSDANLTHNSQILFRYELMDGTPAKGEIIPVRVNLRNVNVAPTMINILNNLTVRYYISVVIIDENDRRYFKKQEVFFYCGKENTDPAIQAFETPCGSSIKFD